MAADKRVALVTGASSGLGLAIAEKLFDAGYRVYGASRKPGAARFETIVMDVDQDASVDAAIAAIVAKEGRLDALISNAGMGFAGALEDTNSEEMLQQFQTNVFGNHRVCRAALPHLRARDRAHIVVIGSLAGLIAIPFQGAYSAAKFALEGYCEALRLELRGARVRVSIVEPGDFKTGFTAARKLTQAAESETYREKFKSALAVIEKDETSGANPVLIAQAIERILKSDRPALRHAVGAAEQTMVARARAFIPPSLLEALIADHYKVS